MTTERGCANDVFDVWFSHFTKPLYDCALNNKLIFLTWVLVHYNSSFDVRSLSDNLQLQLNIYLPIIYFTIPH